MLKRNVKEEERIEKIIRRLTKLPENKRCINCNSLGPQYICTTFWTFVCTNCSGVHREFTHRVKSVSMAKFSADEVAALEAAGNEQARKIYFKTWDPHRNTFPDASNLQRLRDFIKHVYVDQKYSGERNNLNVSLDKTGANDDYSVQQSSENSNRIAREDFFERRTSVKTDQARDFSLVNSDRPLRCYVEQRSSPRYGKQNLKSANRRRRPAQFEIVDDRVREDGVRSGRQLQSNRFLCADVRGRSNSPVSEKGRSKICPPPMQPEKDISGNNVPPPKLLAPPKANDMNNNECSTQIQKAASCTSLVSIDKKEKDHIVNLIDFDENPEPPATTEVVQSLQIVPYGEDVNISSPASKNENASNNPNKNSMDLMFFELSGPAVAPCSTSELPAEGNTPAATGSSVITEAAITHTSTTNASFNPNYIGTNNASSSQNTPELPHVSSHYIATVTQAQQLPAMYQNQSFAVPPGNGGSTLLQTSSSAQSIDEQPFSSELALIKEAATNVSSERLSQDVSNLALDRSSGNESVSMGRKELPANVFAASHSSFAAAAPVWQFHPHYGMGFGTGVSHDSGKSRNPFDLCDDEHQFQAAMFPSMSYFQEAPANTSASPAPWLQQLPPSDNDNSQGMSYAMIHPGMNMGQPSLNTMTPSIPQTVNNAGDNADAFASLNPIQHSRSSNPASARPSSYPSIRENPFG